MKDDNKKEIVSTGPKTPEGKAISSMNALKSGKYMKNFQRLRDRAGSLAICEPCGKAQQAECTALKKCMLQEELIYAYHMAQSERDLSYIEANNAMQLATMDLIFTQRLRWAMDNLGKMERVFSPDGRKSVKVPKVRTEHIYELINTMKALSKSLPDMQLTRQTQENLDVEWAKLLEAKISEERAEEHRQRMVEMMHNWNEAKGKAQKMAKLDSDIQDFIKGESGDTKKLSAGDIGRNPFGNDDSK